MDILDWFNIYDPTHVLAWAEMQSTGSWPKDFIPDIVTTRSSGWDLVLSSRMADQYCKAIIGCTPGQIDDEPTKEPVREDSSAFADTDHVGIGDVFFVPNEGIGIGGVMTMVERDKEYSRQKKKIAGKDPRVTERGFWLYEKEILKLAEEVKAHRTMVSVDNRGERRKHDGFDTERGVDGLPGESDDHFHLDVSQSTLWIGVTQSTGEWLNASAVKHHSYISLRIHGPDGQVLADIGLTFEQFAAALTSNMATPCTNQYYWSRPPNAVQLRERVKPPQSIKDRMAKRLWGSLDGDEKNLKTVMDHIQGVADGTKKMGKRVAEDLLQTLGMVRDYRKSNANFVVGQALEETTAIVEGAAASLAHVHGNLGATKQIIEASGLGDDVKLLEHDDEN